MKPHFLSLSRVMDRIRYPGLLPGLLVLVLSFTGEVRATDQGQSETASGDDAQPAYENVLKAGEEKGAAEENQLADDQSEAGMDDSDKSNAETDSTNDGPDSLFVHEYVPKVDPVTTYLNAIDRAEAEFNAYSIELSDLYLGLGQAFAEAREYEKARQAFQQGVQIERVNFGLDSPRQTNYLFAVADIESTLGNWKDADKVMQDIYRISSKRYGENSLEMLPVLNQMLGWYLSHRPVDAEANRFADLERAESLASKMASITTQHKGMGNPEAAALYRQVGQIQWHTLRYLLAQGISVEPNVVLAMGSPSQNPNTRNISVKDHIESGREAFARAADAVGQDENRSLLDRAEAVAQLGDWNLAFGKRKSAAESYYRAWRMLAEGDESNQFANEYFGKPTPVRFMYGGVVSAIDDSAVSEGVVLDVSMTVSPGGRSLNIEILDPPSELTDEELRQIKRNLSGMKFRPRLELGHAEKTENFVWHLPLTQLEWLQ